MRPGNWLTPWGGNRATRYTMELTVRIGRPMWFSFLISFLVLLIRIPSTEIVQRCCSEGVERAHICANRCARFAWDPHWLLFALECRLPLVRLPSGACSPR
jgi:hypothetical protein